MKVDLIVHHGNLIQYPAMLEGAELSLERKGAPGRLSFSVVQDGALAIAEGDACKLTVDDVDVFFGFVFTKKRSKDGIISVTAYDQLRYLKNKDTMVYENMTATEVISKIARDYELNAGTLEDTGHVIASRVETDSTLFDIIQNALDETLVATRRLFVLYDDVGKLTLRSIESMKLDYLMDADTFGDYDYASSIDGSTYNQIKVMRKEGGGCVVRDDANIDAWGVLQLTQEVEEQGNAQATAEGLLSLYNAPTRALSASDALGDVRVRAGSSIIVQLDLGDIAVSNYMVVESVRHTFNEQQHLMQMKLRGGAFIV